MQLTPREVDIEVSRTILKWSNADSKHAELNANSRFRRETLESQGGASHLILFDTSPLQVHTHANILHAYVYIGNKRTYEDALASANKLFASAGMRFVTPTAEIKAEGRS